MFSVKLAVTVAFPEVSFMVVDAALALVMVAVPVVTFHPANVYPADAAAVIAVDAL